MRNKKLQAAMALTVFLLWPLSSQAANDPGSDPGSSAGPGSMLIFPSFGKNASGLKPVRFNHALHEDKVENCETCHHTGTNAAGDYQSCNSCHTIKGKKEGNFVTLEKAMHATQIAKRAENTPTSCISCHREYTQTKRECAGCHAIIKTKQSEQSCNNCHNGTVDKATMAKGSKGELSIEERGKLAFMLITPKATNLTPLDAPLTVEIDAIAKHYQPHTFNHRRHMNSLMEGIKDNALAAHFHSKPETLCTTCHHNAPMNTTTPSQCSSCHSSQKTMSASDKPNLKAAYHLQCMGCHTGMQVERPLRTSCTACHKKAEMPANTVEKAENKVEQAAN